MTNDHSVKGKEDKGGDTLVLLDIENISHIARDDKPITLGTLDVTMSVVEAIRLVVPQLVGASWFASIAMPNTSSVVMKNASLREQDRLRNYELVASTILRGMVSKGVETVVTPYCPDAADQALLRIFRLHRGKKGRFVLVTQDGNVNGAFGQIVDEVMCDGAELVLVGYYQTPFAHPLGGHAKRYLLQGALRSIAEEMKNPNLTVGGQPSDTDVQSPESFQGNRFIEVVNSVEKTGKFDLGQEDHRFLYTITGHIVNVLVGQSQNDMRSIVFEVQRRMPFGTDRHTIKLACDALGRRTDLFHSKQVLTEDGKFVACFRRSESATTQKVVCK